jgi:tripartite-type tricarboxylate transporter receptor subunit TctC
MKTIRPAGKKRTYSMGLSTLVLFLGFIAAYFAVSPRILQASAIVTLEMRSMLTSTPSPASQGISTPTPHSIYAPAPSTYAALSPSAMPLYKDKTVRVIVPVSPGGSFDVWARLLARHISKHLPGNPSFVVQNMAGGGGLVGANYLYGVAKPDGLTIGTISPNGYLNQLMGRSEVKYDWAKYSWIGSTSTSHELLYIRADTGHKTLDDVIKAAAPPLCGSIGTGTTGSFIPKLLQELFGARFKVVEGYPGGVESDLAVARNEMNCRATSIVTYLYREPTKGWHERGFTRVLVQTGQKHHPALPEVPSVWDLAERRMLPEADRRVMEVVLAGGSFGIPFLAPPAIPDENLRLLREAFVKTMDDFAFRADVERDQGLEVRPVSGHELENLARRIINLPPKEAKDLQRFLSL